jgi:hypothetical protein
VLAVIVASQLSSELAGIGMNLPARRPNGTMMPGSVLNPGGRPRNAIEQLREKYMHRLPELLEGLFELTKSDSPHVRIAATRELLDRLIGKPQISIDAVTAKVDVGAMYLAALKRANGVIDGGNSNNGSAASD